MLSAGWDQHERANPFSAQHTAASFDIQYMQVVTGARARPGVGLLAIRGGDRGRLIPRARAADSRGRSATGVQKGCIDGSQVCGRGSAGPWQTSLGPASGASHHVWSPQWAVSRPTSTTAGHSHSCESASAVCMRVQW
eukprot:scaffold12647_cov59-Phaeocystis_antarctica.AAC.1